VKFVQPFAVLTACFIVLAKSADLFVDAAVGLAVKLNIPKIVIGIFLVGLATTAPELAVSVMSAVRGNPEFALGNAVGSVICDDGLALAAAAVFSAGTIAVIPFVLKTAGIFLLFIDACAFLFVFRDYTLGRLEGAFLLACFGAYSVFLFTTRKRGRIPLPVPAAEPTAEKKAGEKGIPALVLMFGAGLAGIILSSHFIINSAVAIAEIFHIPKTVIALTLIALGTSIPEVATCVIAARKGHGDIAVGNIIGADILNICWVAGASALVHPLTVGRKEIFFMFPAMIVIVASMLAMIRAARYRLKRFHGAVLLALYAAYLGLMILLFPPSV